MLAILAVTVASGVGGGTTVDWTVRVRVAVPVPPALVAESVMEYDPTIVDVPDITPVDVSTDIPEGSPEAPKLVGEFVAVIW